MNTELHKRLEEAAKESFEERYPEGLDLYKNAQIDGFIAGAEYGYKEVESLVGLAVKECKQVMIDRVCEFLEARLFPTVKVQDNEIYVIERWELIEEFRKAMTDKFNLTFEKCLAAVDPDTRKEVRENMEK